MAKLNKTTTFYRIGENLFCRQAGYTHDHEGQLFGRVIEARDIVGEPDGFALRHVDALPLFDEDKHFKTIDAAAAYAKEAYSAYLVYLETDPL